MNPNNPIIAIFSSIYYVVVILPKSLFSKGSKGRKLFQFEKKESGSYFHERNHKFTKKDFDQS